MYGDPRIPQASAVAAIPVTHAPELYDWTHRNPVGDVRWYQDFVGTTDLVLEAAVGTGRIALEIAASGRRVIGVDSSAAMLGRLQGKLGPETAPNIRAVRADMRRMPVPTGRFRRVICPFSSFNYLTSQDEQLRFLREIRRVLAHDGLFSFEILAFSLRDGWLTGAGDAVLVDQGPAADPHGGRTIELWSTYRFDAASQLVSELRDYRILENGREVEQHSIGWLNRFVLPGEMKLLLDLADLQVEELYGDYAGGAARHGSACLVYVCRPSRR